ncbi:MAG: hypothetical protein KKI13_00040 [Candidatus Omnitrophica bacterium]|nr:hypothetical protein [Candidatus Omnitrophota bacterium]MCG2705080.1 hypothetical protein [Candidatus Omnitrophota bacterium]
MKIKKIAAVNFKRYGWLIAHSQKHSKTKNSNLFRIVLKENRRCGWRIAYLILRDKSITRLEKHPGSFESFEPVRGKSLIYLAGSKNPQKIECFYLNRPIVLKKGIWHGVVTLGTESEIKITENAEVKCVFWPLHFPLPR